jgi:hypothetical protein
MSAAWPAVLKDAVALMMMAAAAAIRDVALTICFVLFLGTAARAAKSLNEAKGVRKCLSAP